MHAAALFIVSQEVTRYCMTLSGDLPTLNADVAADATATATAALDSDHAAAAAVDGDASTYWYPPVFGGCGLCCGTL